MFSGFLSTNCTDDALAATRAAFHDCLPGDGGCDGSLVLAPGYERTENDRLADISVKLGNLATKYSVGTANMIQFTGGKVVLLVLLPLLLFFLLSLFLASLLSSLPPSVSSLL